VTDMGKPSFEAILGKFGNTCLLEACVRQNQNL
jgi:hypothetical protein